MNDIIKILTNASVEIFIQNRKYETESIAVGCITSSWMKTDDTIQVIFQGKGKYNKKDTYQEINVDPTSMIYKTSSLKGRSVDKQFEIVIKNEKTRQLLFDAIHHNKLY